MLELSILGFLTEQPLHGYELKERIKALSGHVRPVSDGALYPAITRLVTAGKLDQHTEPGTSAAPRRMLSLTDKGREDLLERLRHPKQAEITDHVRFNTLLAFLRHLPDRREQAAVLRHAAGVPSDAREPLLRGGETRTGGGDRRPVPGGHTAGRTGDRAGRAGLARRGPRTARSARLTRLGQPSCSRRYSLHCSVNSPGVVSSTFRIASSTAPGRFSCAPTAL